MQGTGVTETKVAIVTGSATGAVAALGLARCGFNVLINYSKSEKEALASENA